MLDDRHVQPGNVRQGTDTSERGNRMAKKTEFTKYAGKEKRHIPEDVTYAVDNVPESLAEAIAWNNGGEQGVYNAYMAHVAVMANAAFMGAYKAARKAEQSHVEAAETARAEMLDWRPSIGEKTRLGPVERVAKALGGKSLTFDQLAEIAAAHGISLEAPKGKAKKSA